MDKMFNDMDIDDVDFLDETSNNIDSEQEKQSNIDENGIKDSKTKNLILYIILDKSNPSILQYYRECGINVSKIFTNINEAKDTLLMQIEPVKILIIDTGTGRFSAMGPRKELIDLMGICDEDARVSVYYTDTVIKGEVERNESFESKNISWHKFKSNTDVVAHLLMNRNKETYIYDKEDKDKLKDTPENLLEFAGLNFEEPKQLNIGEPSITAKDIILHRENISNDDNLIGGYIITKI